MRLMLAERTLDVWKANSEMLSLKSGRNKATLEL